MNSLLADLLGGIDPAQLAALRASMPMPADAETQASMFADNL